MSANLPETQLGPYRLDSKLGEGGMGVVYQAMDENLHREVAIKVLHPNLLQHANLKERFRREARMHAKLMHPNVVTLLSIYEDDKYMAIVMEMVHGKNLKEHLRDNPNMTIAKTVHIALAVLKGLEAAHQLSMVHRDLKPANVLIADDGGIKLMDFGLAKPERGDDDLTQDGATVGSFRYMAPEQIMNQPIDARTDLYAFGILLYQMFTGRLPFDSTGSGGEFEIMEKQVREEAVAPHEISHNLPLEISDIILRSLAKNPNDRPSSCKEIYEVLELFENLDQKPKRKMASVRVPRDASGKISNGEIAKGLINAAVSSVGKSFAKLKKGVGRVTQVLILLIRDRLNFSSGNPRWKISLSWAALALFMTSLGWVLISIMGLSDKPTDSENAIASKTTVITSPAKEVVVKPKEIKPVKLEPAKVEETVEKPIIQKPVLVKKPIKKIVKAAPKKVKKKPKRRASRSMIYQVSHQVKRHDLSKVNPKKNEFLGEKIVFFESLKDYKWKDKLRSFKKGETKVVLKKATKLSKIVINKASVGRLNFKGGYVKLAVKDSRGRWHQLFERKDDDVDIRVTITKPRKYLKDVKAVRLRFKTPEPITVGPIDLFR